jgi:hydroxylaminobenzene mutase
LALATGFVIPDFTNPKMALAAHVTGVLNALLLVAVGFVQHLLALSPRLEAAARYLFPAATYANWVFLQPHLLRGTAGRNGYTENARLE